MPSLLLLTLAVGCEEEPRCDGERQADEEVPDAPFDADGDGYVDGENRQCQSAWEPSELDCDDTNPDVSPGAVEITCNGLDDDCRPETSDLDARGCADSYSGTWNLDEPVEYSCALGAVDVAFDRLLLTHDEPDLQMTVLGEGLQPAPIDGSVTVAGVFLGTTEEAGACPRTWTLEGRFTNPNRMDAQLTFDVPEIPACLDCTRRTLSFRATRAIDL